LRALYKSPVYDYGVVMMALRRI